MLAELVPGMDSEQAVIDAVAELNERIMQWRRLPLDSPIFVPLVDEEQMIGRWRAAHPDPPLAATTLTSPASRRPPISASAPGGAAAASRSRLAVAAFRTQPAQRRS